jgi:hypothetical protein
MRWVGDEQGRDLVRPSALPHETMNAQRCGEHQDGHYRCCTIEAQRPAIDPRCPPAAGSGSDRKRRRHIRVCAAARRHVPFRRDA